MLWYRTRHIRSQLLSFTKSGHRLRYLALALVFGCLGLTGSRLLDTVAQESTPMPGMDMPAGAVGLTSMVLARMEPPQAPGLELQLARVEVAEGATVAPHNHPGSIAFCLESGVFMFGVVEGTATRTQAATVATPEAAEELTAGSEVTLQAGDCLTFDASTTVHTLVNTGGPGVIWQAHLYALGEPPTTFLETPVP